jgi:hypothetical protein
LPTIEPWIAASSTAVAETSSTFQVPDRAKWLVLSSPGCAYVFVPASGGGSKRSARARPR